MPFGSSLADLTGTVTKVVATAGTSVAGSIVKSGQQIAQNFGLAKKTDKAVEALNKTVAQGSTNAFKALSADANVKYNVLDKFGRVKTISNAELSAQFSADATDSSQATFVSDSVSDSDGSAEKNTQLKVVISQGPAFVTGNWTERYTNANRDSPSAVPNTIVLDVMPTISESRSVTYEAFSPIHHPGEIMKYRGTGGRKWNVSGRFIARNQQEATLNQIYMNVIRAWTMPFYGNGTSEDSELKRYLGAPPPILTLSAYGDSNISGVKCVLTNYDWTWPNDVDYIPTLNGEPFPVIINISMSLEETWSPSEFSGFNLRKFYEGDLSGAMSDFAGRTQLPQKEQPSENVNVNSSAPDGRPRGGA
jgi:hypothetical protein